MQRLGNIETDFRGKQRPKNSGLERILAGEFSRSPFINNDKINLDEVLAPLKQQNCFSQWNELYKHWKSIESKYVYSKFEDFDSYFRSVRSFLRDTLFIYKKTRTVNSNGNNLPGLIIDYFLTKIFSDFYNSLRSWNKNIGTEQLKSVLAERKDLEKTIADYDQKRIIKLYSRFGKTPAVGYLLTKFSKNVKNLLDIRLELEAKEKEIGRVVRQKDFLDKNLDNVYRLLFSDSLYFVLNICKPKYGLHKDIPLKLFENSYLQADKALKDFEDRKLYGLTCSLLQQYTKLLPASQKKLELMIKGLEYCKKNSYPEKNKEKLIEECYFNVNAFFIVYDQNGCLEPEYILGFLDSADEAIEKLSEEWSLHSKDGNNNGAINAAAHVLNHVFCDLDDYFKNSLSKEQIKKISKQDGRKILPELRKLYGRFSTLALPHTEEKYKAQFSHPLFSHVY